MTQAPETSDNTTPPAEAQRHCNTLRLRAAHRNPPPTINPPSLTLVFPSLYSL